MTDSASDPPVSDPPTSRTPPLPQPQRWQTGGVVEEFTVRWDNDGWTAEGAVHGHSQQVVLHVLRCRADWTVTQILVFRAGDDDPSLWLRGDGQGRWADMRAGQWRNDLDGCRTVSLAWSPAGAWLADQRGGPYADDPGPALVIDHQLTVRAG